MEVMTMIADSVWFAVGLVAVFVLWRRVAVPSMVDHYRDKLFDLRDEVRERFLAQPDGLGSAEYKALRDLINGHILYLDRISIFSIAYLLAWFRATPEAAKEFRSSALANIDGEAARKYSADVRARAASTAFEYAANASLSVWALSLIVVPLVLVTQFLLSGFRSVNTAPRLGFARLVVLVFSLVGLQGKMKPSVESIIERAATENARVLAHQGKNGTDSPKVA